MIVTLTPNPSHDRTVTLAAPLERGAVQRAESVISQAGGKGVNISRASIAAGIPSIAVLPASKDDPFVLELLAAGIDCRPVHNSGTLRVNITISEPDGTTTKLNSPGPTVSPEVLAGLTGALLRRAASADWVVLAGSLPPGGTTVSSAPPCPSAITGRPAAMASSGVIPKSSSVGKTKTPEKRFASRRRRSGSTTSSATISSRGCAAIPDHSSASPG